MTDLQLAVAALQKVLNLRIHSGQITLNIHQDRLQSVETKTYQRIGVDESGKSA